MNNKKTVLALALGAATGAAMPVQAAMVFYDDMLTIDSGIWAEDAYGNVTSVASGSWFGFDTDGNGKIAGAEQIVITGLDGIRIDSTQSPGEIDTWMFGAVAGYHYTTVSPRGGTTHGLDFSGWSVAWGAVPLVPMGVGAWTPLNCASTWMGCDGVAFADGVAAFSWDGNYGSAYSLWYSATVPDGDPSGFGNVRYVLYLEGTVEWNHIDPPPVPLPGAAWLLGTGLVGIFCAARRKARG